MKRIISLVLAVSMILGVFATVFAAQSYSDLVGENKKYAGAVDALSELRVDDQPVINGYPDGTFGPEKTVTRAELAKMLVVCLGLGSEVEALATKSVFTDVPTNHWAAGWINAAAQSKVIVGYPDGSFGPEKTVTYAEAFTMALRALGYGNVADFEGTWPTSYMLKAVELDLTRDMDGVKTDVAATRGNIAILLWNMLRTKMWKVTSESEKSGMTLSAENEQYMLNVKFPDYAYLDDVYVYDVVVSDKEDVTLQLAEYDTDDGLVPLDVKGQAYGIDLTRLVKGEKVTVLMKVAKNGNDPVYLTVTPANTLVCGPVEKIDGKKVTVDGTEYTFQDEDSIEFAMNDYVIFETTGRKVTYLKAEDYEVVKFFEAKELAKSILIEDGKTAERKVKEDELVIRDGEWVERDDIEEGDIITRMGDWENGKEYWQVASVDARISGTFESYTTEKVSKPVAAESHYLEIDGEKYRNIITDSLTVKEDDKDIKIADLQAKNNKYLDADVELGVDFLGNPFIMWFTDVEAVSSDANFFAVVNGIWQSSGKKSVDNIALVGFDGEGASEDDETAAEGADYEIKRGAKLGWDHTDKELLASGEVVFVWIDTDEDQIKTLVPFGDGLTSGEDNYKGKYTVIPYAGKLDGKKLSGDPAVRIPADVPVLTVTPIKDEDENVIGFAAEVSEGLEEDAELLEGSYVAYDASKAAPKAAFVFVAEEARSTEVHYGIVENYDENARRGIKHVTIDGEEYEYDEENSDDTPVEDALVGYTLYKGKAAIKKVLKGSDIDDDKVHIISDETETDYIVCKESGDQYDLDEDSEASKKYKKYKVVTIGVDVDKNGDVVFDSAEEEDTKGLRGIENKPGVRFIFDDKNKTILVFVGLGKKDEVSEGHVDTNSGNAVVVGGETEEDQTPEDEGTPEENETV